MLDDVHIPRKLFHLFSKIDRRCKAFCAELFSKAFSRVLNWKYHTKINISCLSEVIALFFQPSEYIAVIVLRANHILNRFPSFGLSRDAR